MANPTTSVLGSEQISERVRSMSGWQLLVRWGEVTVHLSSHDAGGVADKHIKLAQKIDQI